MFCETGKMFLNVFKCGVFKWLFVAQSCHMGTRGCLWPGRHTRQWKGLQTGRSSRTITWLVRCSWQAQGSGFLLENQGNLREVAFHWKIREISGKWPFIGKSGKSQRSGVSLENQGNRWAPQGDLENAKMSGQSHGMFSESLIFHDWDTHTHVNAQHFSL